MAQSEIVDARHRVLGGGAWHTRDIGQAVDAFGQLSDGLVDGVWLRQVDLYEARQ
ncbi:hypothetical protein D3C84_1205280 [compost metagenome]